MVAFVSLEDGGSMFLETVDTHLQHGVRTQKATVDVFSKWEPDISQGNYYLLFRIAGKKLLKYGDLSSLCCEEFNIFSVLE
jgi:hypothetical protein